MRLRRKSESSFIWKNPGVDSDLIKEHGALDNQCQERLSSCFWRMATPFQDQKSKGKKFESIS